MVDVSALYNMDVSRIEDIYMGVDFCKYTGEYYYYIVAVLKSELLSYELKCLGTYNDSTLAALALLNFKKELERLRKEDAE